MWNNAYLLPLDVGVKASSEIIDKTSILVSLRDKMAENGIPLNSENSSNFTILPQFHVDDFTGPNDPTTISVTKEMTSQIKEMSDIGNMGFFMGRAIINTTASGSNIDVIDKIQSYFLSFFTGSLLVIIFLITLISFPFYFIDILFRSTFLVAFSPMIFLGVFFKRTGDWFWSMLKGLLHSAVMLIGMGFIYSIIGSLIMYAPYTYEVPAGYTSIYPEKTFPWMIDIMDKSGIGLALNDSAYLMLLMSGVFAGTIMKQLSGQVGAIFGFSTDEGLVGRVQKLTMGGVQFGATAALTAASLGGGLALKGARLKKGLGVPKADPGSGE